MYMQQFSQHLTNKKHIFFITIYHKINDHKTCIHTGTCIEFTYTVACTTHIEFILTPALTPSLALPFSVAHTQYYRSYADLLSFISSECFMRYGGTATPINATILFASQYNALLNVCLHCCRGFEGAGTLYNSSVDIHTFGLHIKARRYTLYNMYDK